MNIKQQFSAILALVICLVVSGCGPSQSSPQSASTTSELKDVLQEEGFTGEDGNYIYDDKTVDYVNLMTVRSNTDGLVIDFAVDSQGMPKGSNKLVLNDLLIRIYDAKVADWIFKSLPKAVSEILKAPRDFGDSNKIELKGTPSNYDVTILMEDVSGIHTVVTITIMPLPSGIADTK